MLKIFETGDVERPGLWARFVHWVEGRPSAKMAAENESLKWKVADLESRLDSCQRANGTNAKTYLNTLEELRLATQRAGRLSDQLQNLQNENCLISSRFEIAERQIGLAKARLEKIRELSGFFDDQWNFSDIEEAS